MDFIDGAAIAMIVIIGILLLGLILFSDTDSETKNFKVACAALHGTPHIGSDNLCLSEDGRVLLWSD